MYLAEHHLDGYVKFCICLELAVWDMCAVRFTNLKKKNKFWVFFPFCIFRRIHTWNECRVAFDELRQEFQREDMPNIGRQSLRFKNRNLKSPEYRHKFNRMLRPTDTHTSVLPFFYTKWFVFSLPMRALLRIPH